MNFFSKKRFSIQLFFFLLLCIFIVPDLVAQQQIKVPDSLKNKSPEELTDRIKFSTPEEAIIYENALLNRHNQDINTAGYYLQLGHFFYGKEEYERCIKYLTQAVIHAKKINDDMLLCPIYLLQGNAYLQDWKNQEALDSYYNVLYTARKKGNLEQEIIANSGITIVLRRMKQLDKAVEVGRQALELIDKTSFKNARNHVNILTIVSETHLDKRQYDSVLYYAGKGIEISKALDYKKGLVDLYIKKGIVFYHQENYKQAFDFLIKAKAILLKANIKNSFFQKIYVNYFMASCFYKQSTYDKAISYLMQRQLHTLWDKIK